MRILESIVLVHTWGFPCPLNRWEAEKSQDFSDFWVDALEIEDFCWKRQTSNFTHIYLKTRSALRQVQHSTRSWNCAWKEFHPFRSYLVRHPYLRNRINRAFINFLQSFVNLGLQLLQLRHGSGNLGPWFPRPPSASACSACSPARVEPIKAIKASSTRTSNQPRSKARTNVIRNEDLCWSRYPFEDLC